MRELNFFSQLIKARKKKKRGMLIVILLISLIVMSAAGSVVFLQVSTNGMIKEIEFYRNEIDKKKGAGGNEDLLNSLNNMIGVEKMKNQILKINSFFEENSEVSVENTVRIFNCLTEGVSISYYDLDNEGFTLGCISTSEVDAYSTLKNLKDAGFEAVRVSTITVLENDKKMYSYTIKGKVGRSYE